MHATISSIITSYRRRLVTDYLARTSYLYTVVLAFNARQITVDELRYLLRY